MDINTTASMDSTLMYITSSRNFEKIPSSPIAYWAEQGIFDAFDSGISIGDIAEPKQGIIPGNVEVFLRLWSEVDYTKIGFGHKQYDDIMLYRKKWFPYNKGGGFRRWYGNLEYIINMENNGYDIKYSGANNNYRLRDPELYFQEAISWSKISTGILSMRYEPTGTLFDIAGCCIFGLANKTAYILGLVNSSVIMKIISFIAPTLNYEVEAIKKLPVLFENEDKKYIDDKVNENIGMCKKDWDAFETSWDFKKHPLV